jgi:hypothetical protein
VYLETSLRVPRELAITPTFLLAALDAPVPAAPNPGIMSVETNLVARTGFPEKQLKDRRMR